MRRRSVIDKADLNHNFDKGSQMLTYYELDLGLNHVVRKWSEPTDPRANLLVQVPGGQLASSDRYDGPSGVLVCCEDHIIYRHMDAPQHRVPIPRRQHPLSDPNRGLIITAAVMHKMKVRTPGRLSCCILLIFGVSNQGAFFFLLQSEEGDLYKVTIDHDDQDVRALKIKYFDTVPVASGLCILKSGFLFVASEFGNQLSASFSSSRLRDTDRDTFAATCTNSRSSETTTTSPSSHPPRTPPSAWPIPRRPFPSRTSDRAP